MAGIPSSQLTAPPEAATPAPSKAQLEFQESKKLLDEMVQLRERKRGMGQAIDPQFEDAIKSQMGVVGRREYWLNNPAVEPAPAPQPRVAPQAPQAQQFPMAAQPLGPPSPSAPEQPGAQPARLEWNGPQQPRNQFVMPPAQPLAPSRPQSVMTLPPQSVMTSPPQEVQGTPPQMMREAPPPQSMPSRNMPAPQPQQAPQQPRRGIPSSELSGFGGPQRGIASSDIAGGEKPLNWSDVPGQALLNLPSSAGQFAQAVVQPILHPIDTLNAFKEIGLGIASKVYGAVGGAQDPEVKAKTEATANALGQHFAERYGTVEGFKKALATDPVGIMADASMVLTGGAAAAARAPGAVAAGTSRALTTAASAVDPIANVGRVARGAGTAITETLGVTTGAGSRPLREAYAAGQTGNQAFTDNMRGNVPIGDVVDTAQGAVQAMGRDRRAAYNANMTATRADHTPIDITPIENALTQARDMVEHVSPSGQRIVHSPVAAQTHTQIAQLLNEFRRLPPAERTAEALDALKRGVSAIQQGTRQGTTENAVAASVFGSVRNAIETQVPSYAQAMGEYQAASGAIDEMRRTMSLNNRATPDTTLRKLQSTMRNNVNTNYGARERLLDVLAQYEPDLPAALAGQSLNALAPRGLARVGPAVGAYGAITNPASLAALPFASPRVMGEAYYGAGQANNALAQALAAAGLTPDVLASLYRGGYTAGTVEQGSRTNALAQ